MKIKLIVCTLVSLCVLISSANTSYCKNVQKAKVNLSKEFNDFQNVKTKKIDDITKNATESKSVIKIENNTTNPIQNSDGSVKEVKLKYITTKEAAATLEKIYPASGISSSWNKPDDSSKIKISTSEQTNSIILVGDKVDIIKAEEVINKIDQEPIRVMIQCIMTTLDAQASKAIGAALSSFNTGTINSLSYDPTATDGLAKLTYGVLHNDRFPTKFSVLLDDLVSTTKAKIIAKPYTVVKSGKQAKVSVGNTSYIILTTQGAYATTQNLEKVETGTNMEITPTLLDNDFVSMDILISDSYLSGSPDAAIAFYTNTSKAATNITVKNGETIVIGGLNNRSEGSFRRGFPFLSFIPFLGYKTHDKNEKEVVFFITPYILDKTATEGL